MLNVIKYAATVGWLWSWCQNTHMRRLKINTGVTDSWTASHPKHPPSPPPIQQRCACVRVHMCLFWGSGFTRGRPPMAQLLGQVWKEPCRRTGGRAGEGGGSGSEPAMSKHKHGWVYNESEERCHAASSGQRRPKASLERRMKRSKTGEKSGFLKEAICICVEAGLLIDLTQIQVKNI